MASEASSRVIRGAETPAGGIEEDQLDREGLRPRSHLPRVGFRLEQRRHVRYFLAVATAVTLSWLLRWMPRTLRRWLANTIGDLSFRWSSGYRDNVESNLRHLLGDDVPAARIEAATRDVFRTNSANFLDLLHMPHLDASAVARRVRPIAGSWSYLDDALAKGKGAVIITAHLGAFDFIGQAVHQRGYKLTSVTGRTTSRFLFDAVTFLRRSHEMNLVEASPSGIRNVYRAIKRGECAVFLTDRDFFLSGVKVRLFGEETTLPQGAVRVARDSGAPIVPIFGIRTGSGHGLIFEPPFEIPRTRDRDTDIALGLERIVETLERVIGSAPEQWVMFQRVWPSEPDAPAPA